MTVGCLGDIVFEVNAETVRTLNNFRWSGSAAYATHKRQGTNALTEFTGTDPDQLSFAMLLNRSLGADPMEEIRKIWQYERSGEAVSLVLGDHVYGKYRWNIKSHQTKAEHFDGRGNLLSATVEVSLQEYLRE